MALEGVPQYWRSPRRAMAGYVHTGTSEGIRRRVRHDPCGRCLLPANLSDQNGHFLRHGPATPRPRRTGSDHLSVSFSYEPDLLDHKPSNKSARVDGLVAGYGREERVASERRRGGATCVRFRSAETDLRRVQNSSTREQSARRQGLGWKEVPPQRVRRTLAAT